MIIFITVKIEPVKHQKKITLCISDTNLTCCQNMTKFTHEFTKNLMFIFPQNTFENDSLASGTRHGIRKSNDMSHLFAPSLNIKQVLSVQTRVNLGVMTIKGYSQRSSITRASPLSLVSYPEHSLRGSYPSPDIEAVYSTAQANWSVFGVKYFYLILIICPQFYIFQYSYLILVIIFI